MQRGEVKRRASVEGKSAGPAPGPHTGVVRGLSGHHLAFSTGRARGPPHRALRPCPGAEGSYPSPYTAQDTRGTCSHLNHSPFAARKVLIPQIQPQGHPLHPSPGQALHNPKGTVLR